jgi:hypothetical protein
MMADDNNPRYRSSDPSSRGPSSAPASDPLAELARLIGQSDPFADLGRKNRSQPREGNTGFADMPAPHYGASDNPDRFGGEQAPYPAADRAPRFAGGRPFNDAWPGEEPSSNPYAQPLGDPYAQPPPLPGPARGEPYLDSASSAESFPRFPLDPGPPPEPALADANPPEFLQAADRPQMPPPLYPEEPEAGAMPPPHEDEFYDDAPRRDRRKGLLTVAAVFGLAVIGTAGAFGYRSLFGGTGASLPPPVIRASGEPTKVAPPPAKTDPSASKFTYDRFGDRSKNEQVVVREEKPVDPNQIARSTVPRTVLPASPPSQVMSPRPGAVVAPPAAAGVRTVPIRPDEPDTAAGIRPTPPPAPVPAAPPPRQTASAGNSQTNSQAMSEPAAPPEPARADPPVAARAQSARNAPRVASRAVTPPPPARSANAPLSLSPEGANAPPPTAPQSALPPPTPLQSVPPQRTASAPTKLSSALSSGGGGGYLVQVSSQRSEADAESAFRNLQSKYSSVLRGQPHLIRRANLGNRGTYYRAMVGPFGSRDQAIQLCTSLKAAGGDCLIQSN